MILLLAALAVFFLGAISALITARTPRVASSLGMSGAVVGSGLGGVWAIQGLLSGTVETLKLPWAVPNGGVTLGIDPLSAFFLVPLFALSMVTAVYGRAYLLEYASRHSLGLPWAAFNLFVAAITLVVVARSAVFFLLAWEVMSLAGYMLVIFEHEQPSVRRAGWVYLVATHLGVAALMAFFLVLRQATGSFEFDAPLAPGALSPAASSLLFLLALVGFGAKAGLVPLHVWLPEAHAAAPSHVSALMSGVLIKMGIYGILRVVILLDGPQTYWGPLLMVLGLLGGALGIGLGLVQRDLKRVLAYSSIENVGLITLGLGIGLWGVAVENPWLVLLGFTGGLLHVWNHAAMKGLMFLSAGSVLHGTHTKDLEKLGGLTRRMPITGSAMVVGAVAIAGLPPLNGFVSEWLLYSGLLQGAMAPEAGAGTAFLVAVAFLSLIGAMAALCFVRLIGVGLLGEPRSAGAKRAHESPALMTGPLMLLVLVLMGLAVTPWVAEAPILRVITQVTGRVPALEPGQSLGLERLGLLNAVLLGVLMVAGLGASLLFRRSRATSDATWGCGYVAPTVRMQYTARSFGEFFTSELFPRSLSPRLSVKAPQGLFPKPGSLAVDTADPLMQRSYEPFFAWWAERFARLRWMQQGLLHVYVVYILAALVFGLAFSASQFWGD